jgi:hypothetical protein
VVFSFFWGVLSIFPFSSSSFFGSCPHYSSFSSAEIASAVSTAATVAGGTALLMGRCRWRLATFSVCGGGKWKL